MSLGSLGGSKRRRSTNGVLGGAVSLGATCAEEIANDPNSYDSAGGYTRSAQAALTACPITTGGGGTTTTTSGGGGTSSSIPGAFWPDTRVKAVQNELDVLLAQAGCATRMVAAGKTADGLIGGGTCGALAWAKGRGTPPATYARYISDFDRGCAAFTLKMPACPAGGTVSPTIVAASALPFQVGVKNATAQKWQYLLNSELQPRGLPTVPEDGVFTKATCNGFVAFSRSFSSNHEPYPDESFTEMWGQYGGVITQACTALATQAPPVTQQQPPTIPATRADPVALMKQMQTMQNAWLTSVGYQPAAVTGKWDGPTCGAGALMVKTLPASDARLVALKAVFAQLQPLLGAPCGVTVQPVAPTKVPVVAPPVTRKTPLTPPVARRSTSLLPLDREGQCIIDPGTKNAEIRVIQTQLNATLAKNGYTPIPVTGVWDAATCGALFELRGAFVPASSYDCQNAYSIPLSCPAMTPPTKAYTYTPPKKQASMAVPLGIAAVLVTVGLVVAKKKGLIMAAKKAAVRA